MLPKHEGLWFAVGTEILDRYCLESNGSRRALRLYEYCSRTCIVNVWLPELSINAVLDDSLRTTPLLDNAPGESCRDIKLLKKSLGRWGTLEVPMYRGEG